MRVAAKQIVNERKRSFMSEASYRHAQEQKCEGKRGWNVLFIG